MTDVDANPAEAFVRLHITPFDSSLVSVILPTALRSQARNISFHVHQTSPDRPYGFLELPAADAEKIKKRLHGSVLKGHKIRIGSARPDYMARRAAAEVDDAAAETAAVAKEEKKRLKAEKKENKVKKRKRDETEELNGVELEEGRRVKRGWTVSPDEIKAKDDKAKKRKRDRSDAGKAARKGEKKRQKKEAKSQYTDGPECLVQTVLPQNKVDVAPPDGKGKDKKKKKSKSDRPREVMVHEFENTTKFPSFLKSAAPSATTGADLEYVEGQGWVDANGTVVEPLKSSRPGAKRIVPVLVERDDTSSEESEADATPKQSPSGERPKSSHSAKSLKIDILPPPTTAEIAEPEVHPLEALYKRPKPSKQADTTEATAPTAEPFSFFGGADEDKDSEEDIEVEDATPRKNPGLAIQVPMTPFTRQDFDWRNTRSAAPTPDTAHPSRMNSMNWRASLERDEGEDVEMLGTVEEDTQVETLGAEGNEIDENEDGPADPDKNFQKWFWEHRGDINRSWKRRRREVNKEKRYRDNKARASRAI